MAKKLILVDTNFLILAMADKYRYGELLKKIIEKKRLAISVIVVAEFLAKAIDSERKVLLTLVEYFGVVEINLNVAMTAGDYRQKFLKLRRKTKLPDCLIGASCKVNNLGLLTLNKKDYPMRDIDFVDLNDLRN